MKKWTFLQLNLRDGAKTRYVLPFETEVFDPCIDEFGDISYNIIYRNKKYEISSCYLVDSEKESAKQMFRMLLSNINWHDFETYPGNAPTGNWEIFVKKSKKYITRLEKLYMKVYPEIFV